MAYLRSVDMPFLFQLQFTSTTFLSLLFCILLGIGYAILLYKPRQLNSSLNKSLFALRSLAVASIAFLLVAPMIKFSANTTEKPLIILAQDNSASISLSKPLNFDTADYTKDLKDLEKELSKNHEVKSLTFGTTVKTGLNLNYKESLTDINSLFKHINEQYPNRNIGAVILSSDGIYNQGGNPEYEAQNLKSPVYTIALGDTIAKKDLLIANVNYNNIAYLGNDFQVEISIEAFQSRGISSRLSVSGSSGTVFSKGIVVGSNEFRLNIPVTLSAKKKGIQRFTVNLSPVSGELSTQNNTQTFFVEVIDGKNKVVILANSPHPDISAIKQSIELNKNYEVKSVLISDYKSSDITDAGLIILHQLPSAGTDIKPILQQAGNKPVWYILGAQTDVSSFSAMQSLLTINSASASEEVIAKVNDDFYEFTLSEQTLNNLQNFAPLLSPFGSYAVKSPASILFNQQIGKLATTRPLLLFSKDADKKVGVLTGEGLWRWRLEDFKETGTHKAVDELLTKVIQFMVTKDDKRKFRVYPAKNTFDESENVILNAELYNDSYELINSPDVAITLKQGNSKTYPYLFTRTGNAYILNAGILPSGEYSYSASTQLGKTKYSASGQFAVVEQQTEYRQTTANHQLLYNLSALNNGELFYPSDIKTLADKIKRNELIKTISYEDRRYEDLISLKIIFFLILALISTEWFLRKRNGEV
ncbi:hypothetical protein WG906_15745 [Pedobacter sp. P351]|uniref:hypothetical protein n=1 Tax=Pedobacter superstes TaxID=3133441 RepID=UPI00309A2C40